MKKSLLLFRASQEEFFTDYDETVAALLEANESLKSRIEHLEELTFDALKSGAINKPSQHDLEGWSYDARLPNIFFDDLFPLEIVNDYPKRWVGETGSIKGRLALPRHVQYKLTIAISNLSEPAGQSDLYLKIDGLSYPWLSTEDWLFSTIVLESVDADGLEFEIGIDRETVPIEVDVSFAFTWIRIDRHPPKGSVDAA